MIFLYFYKKDETKIQKHYKHAELMGIDCLSKIMMNFVIDARC